MLPLAKKKKKTFLIISGMIITLSLLVGGSFLIYRNSSGQTSDSPSNTPSQKAKNPPPPKNNLPPSDQPNNPPQSPPPKPNPVNNNHNKTELKVLWYGLPSIIIDGYDDYWVFVSSKEPAKRFLISQKNPVLLNKYLYDSGEFTLAYAENEIVKKIVKTSQGSSQLILLESGFTLTPDSPLQADPDFLDDFLKNKNETKEIVQFVAEANNEDQQNTLIFNNYFADENGRKPAVLKVFHITTDSLLASQLICQNKLQKGKKFILSFTEVAEYDEILNLWYFDSSCDRKIWISEL